MLENMELFLSWAAKENMFPFSAGKHYFLKILTACYFSPTFPVRKIPAHQLFTSSRGRAFYAAVSPCGCSLIRNMVAAEPWCCSPLESMDLFWQGGKGQSFLGISLQWHLAVEWMVVVKIHNKGWSWFWKCSGFFFSIKKKNPYFNL